jgi:hypothetical protein
VDVTFPKRAKGFQPVPMWLGPELGDRLLAETGTGRNKLYSFYLDCASLDPGKCSPDVQVISAPVCQRNLGQQLIDGTYGGMERRRGGLVLHFDRDGVFSTGVSTYLVSGGREVRISSDWGEGSRTAISRWHLRAIDSLREVGEDAPPARFEPPVFAASTVSKAGQLLRLYQRTGSLKKAAIKLGLFGGKGKWQVTFRYERKGALAWLRFARDLKNLGSSKTVTCGDSRST